MVCTYLCAGDASAGGLSKPNKKLIGGLYKDKMDAFSNPIKMLIGGICINIYMMDSRSLTMTY